MREPTYRTRRQGNKRLVVLVVVAAGLLVSGILLMAGGSDDPVAKQLVPPLSTEQTAGEAKPSPEQLRNQSAAIDGAPGPKSKVTGDHDDGLTAPQPTEATNSGSITSTAKRFAELMINWPTDQLEAAANNKELLTLATGTLASDLANGIGSISTAQAPSTGEILDTMVLEQSGDYAEVLIVSKSSVVDVASKQPLDPSYLNYLVRLQKVKGGSWAVTSWEPQL